MNLETLSQTLQKLEITLPVSDLEANWQQFQQETGVATLPAFALWLHARALDFRRTGIRLLYRLSEHL